MGHRSLTRDRHFSFDSALYVDVARNWLAGRGLTVNLVYFPNARYPGAFTIPQPFTNQPPFYPVSIAVLSRLGLDPADAALILPVLCYCGILLLSTVLMRRLYGWPAALIALALLATSYPLRSVSAVAWSESLGILLSLLSVFTLIRLEGDRWRLGVVACAGIAAGLSFATRYAFLVSLPAGLLLLVDRHRIRASAARILSFSAGFVAIAGPVVLRNWMNTGMFTGPVRHPSPIPLLDHLAQSLYLLAGQYASRRATSLQIGILLASLAAAFVWASLRGRSVRCIIDEMLVKGDRYRLYVWPSLYVLALVLASLQHNYETINARLIAPAVPFVAFAWAALLQRALRPSLAVASLIASLAAMVPFVDDVRAVAATKAFNPRKQIRESARLQWVRDATTPADLIVGDGTDDLLLLFGRETVYLGPFPPADPLTSARLCALLRETGCGRYRNIYVVLQDRRLTEGQWRDQAGPFWTDLVLGREGGAPQITPVARLDDAFVFQWHCLPCADSR